MSFWVWIPMWASGSISVVIGRRGFQDSDREPRLPSKRPIWVVKQRLHRHLLIDLGAATGYGSGGWLPPRPSVY